MKKYRVYISFVAQKRTDYEPFLERISGDKKHAHTFNEKRFKSVHNHRNGAGWLLSIPLRTAKIFNYHPSFLFNPFCIGGSMLPVGDRHHKVLKEKRKQKHGEWRMERNEIRSETSDNLSSMYCSSTALLRMMRMSILCRLVALAFLIFRRSHAPKTSHFKRFFFCLAGMPPISMYKCNEKSQQKQMHTHPEEENCK